jgi:zinc transporter ZupT
LLLNSVNASVYGTQISKSLPKKEWLLNAAATGPLVGFLIAFALPAEGIVAQLVFAFVVGALLFAVFRDVMPSEKKVNTELLLIGILVSLFSLQIAGLLF